MAPANPGSRADPQDHHMQGTQHHGEENQKEHSPPGHPPASSSPNTSSLHCCICGFLLCEVCALEAWRPSVMVSDFLGRGSCGSSSHVLSLPSLRFPEGNNSVQSCFWTLLFCGTLDVAIDSHKGTKAQPPNLHIHLSLHQTDSFLSQISI